MTPDNNVVPVPQNTPVDFPDGMVGEIAEFVMKAAHIPNQAFSCATGLLVTSGLSRNRFVVDRTLTTLNPAIAVIGGSGAGKNIIKQAINQLLFKAGAADCSTNSVASASALRKAVAEATDHTLVYVHDEFWSLIRAANNQNMQHQSMLVAELMDIVTNANGTHAGVRYSSQENIEPIERPFVMFCGITTADRFIEQLNDYHIKDGFLNRFVVIQSNHRVRPNSPELDLQQVPPKLYGAIKGLWNSGSIGMVNENSDSLNRIVIKWEEDAFNLMDQFGVTAFNKYTSDPVAGDLWSRCWENACAVAGILAVGVSHSKPRITLEQAKWAINLVSHCTTEFSALLGNKMSSSRFDADCKQVMEYISDPGGHCKESLFQPLVTAGIAPHSWVSKRMRNLNKQGFRQVIEKLLETGQIIRGRKNNRLCYAIARSTSAESLDEVLEGIE